MFVCCECCVLSGRGLCDGLITRPEESYRLWRVVVCDKETSKTRRLKPATGAVKIQPQWVVTPGQQNNNEQQFILNKHTCLRRWNRQSVPKRRHIKFRRRGINQKKAYDIQNTAKVWNQEVQGGSNMTGTDLCVNKPHCVAAVRPSESEATTSTLSPARVRTCSVLSGSC